MSKNLSELSTEELLKEAKTAPELEEEIVDDVLLFLKEFDIKPGSERVKNTLLNKLYIAWSKNPVSKQRFSIELGLHFEREKDFFLINYNSINLSQTTKDYYLKHKSKKSIVDNYSFRHMDYFLKKYHIIKGNHAVSQEVIWGTYKKHSRGKKNALKKNTFIKYLELFLVKKNKTFMVNVFSYVDGKNAHEQKKENK